jgi:hypothetical protein
MEAKLQMRTILCFCCRTTGFALGLCRFDSEPLLCGTYSKRRRLKREMALSITMKSLTLLNGSCTIPWL